jgi:hypothetical protein
MIMAAFVHEFASNSPVISTAVAFILNHLTLIALLASCFGLIVYCHKHQTWKKGYALCRAPKPATAVQAVGSIVPLRDFRWQETEPLQYRPFKPQYHLTMGNNTGPLVYYPSRLMQLSYPAGRRLGVGPDRSKVPRED